MDSLFSWVRPTRHGDPDGDVEVVRYASTHKKNQTSFRATSEPNSAHAADLARLAAVVHGEQPPTRRKHKSQALLPQTASRQQVMYLEGRRMTTEQPIHQVTEEETDSRSIGYTQLASAALKDEERRPRSQEGPLFASHEYPTSLPYSVQQQDTQRIVQYQELNGEESLRAQRYESEDTTTYKVKGPNGDMLVSAPRGSNEAQLFDEIAKRASRSKEANKNSGSRVTERQKSKKKIFLIG